MVFAWSMALLFVGWCGGHRDLHSFSTRRSSDLGRNPGIRRPGRLAVVDGRGKRGVELAVLVDLADGVRSEEHTSELQSRGHLVCRLLLEKKKKGAWALPDAS